MKRVKTYSSHLSGNWVSWLMILSLGLMVGVFCELTPWIDDDLMYQYNCRWSEQGIWIPVKTIGDVFESQNVHYFYTNGRYVAHWLVQLFDGVLGRTVFAICNALVYILFVRMIMLLTGVKLSNKAGTLTTVCLVITCQCVRMSPAFQMYIWMFLLTLCFIRLILNYKTKNPLMIALLCVFSLICGNSHEAFTPGVSFGLGVFFIINYRKTTLQQWLMLAFFIAGLLLLAYSPATQNRMIDTAKGFEYRLLAFYTLRRAVPAFFILVAVTGYKLLWQRVGIVNLIKSHLLWWMIWLGCSMMVLFFGFSGGRAVLGEELSAVILVISMMKKKSFTPFWLILLSVATGVFIFWQGRKVFETRHYMDEIRRQALTNKDGNIYVDYLYSSPIAGLEEYSGRVRNVNFFGEPLEERYMSLFSSHFTKEWGVDHPIRLYPPALRPYIENKVDTTAGNQLVEISPGRILFILNKKHPAKFYGIFRRDIPLFQKTYEPVEIFPHEGIYETDVWRATIMSTASYHIAYPATFYMEDK